MNINKDMKRIGVVLAIVAMSCSMIGAMLGIFAYSQYYVPPIEPQWLSRLHRLIVDSNADVTTVVFQGHTTQTNNIVEVQQSDGTRVFAVSNDGDAVITGTLWVSGTSDLQGDVADSLGDFTIADNLAVTGTLSVTGGITFAGSIRAANVDATGYVSATSNITGATLAATGLTNGRVALVTTGGQLADDSDLTFATDTLTATRLVVTSTSDLQGNIANSGGDLSVVDTVEITGAVHLQGSGLTSDYFAGLTYGDLGSAKSVDASSGPSHVLPIQVNIQNTANPASAKTIAAAYFKAATATANQGNAQICGVLPRVTIGHDVASSYGEQSHSTRNGDADVAGEFCAGSFKLDVGSGAQMSGENWAFQAILDGSAAKSSSNSTGVGRFQLYANANADYLVHLQAASGTNVSQGLYVSNHGTMNDAIQINSTGDGTVVSGIDMLGTFSGYAIDLSDATISTAEIRGSNSETIANTTDGEWDITGDIDGAGEFQVGTFLNLTVQTEISVTNGTVFTPTGTYQLIAAAAEVTPTISTSGFSVGDMLELHNTETAVINFAAGGTQLLKDDYPMDQYDVLSLRWNGAAWVELYRTGPRI